MDIMAYIADRTANHQNASLNDIKVKEILSDNKSYVKEAKDTSFITKKGEYEIPYSELYTATEVTPVASTPTDIYVAKYNDGTVVLSNNTDDIDISKVNGSILNASENLNNNILGAYDEWDTHSVIILNKIVPTNCRGWFNRFINLERIVDLQNLDTSLVTDMTAMFGTCEKLTVDLSSFDTKNVTSMNSMFANTWGMEDFAGTPLSQITGLEKLDMSNVTDMSYMFADIAYSDNLDRYAAVLTMCIKATKIPSESRTLSNLGFSSYRMEQFQNTQNFQNFLNAGWTTGY